MNIRELIAELQKLDPEMPVAVSGYEGGLEILQRVELVEIIEGADGMEDWWGTHLFNDGFMIKNGLANIAPKAGAKPFMAVHLPRLRFRV